MVRPIDKGIKTHLTKGAESSVSKVVVQDGNYDPRPLLQNQRYVNTELASHQSGMWRHFDVGAVIVRETDDFRYSPDSSTCDEHVNTCGLSIIEGAFKMLCGSKNVPTWLAFPAGLFWYELPDDNVEMAAAAFVLRLVKESKLICDISKELFLQGMKGFFVGVDGGGHQVPVHIKFFKNRNPLPIVMPRRAEGFDKPPESLERRRQLDGPPSVFVSYCGELMETGACGVVGGFQLGKDEPPDYVLDLTHYFRWQIPFQDIGHYANAAMAKASGRHFLNAPIIASTVLVNRSFCLSPYPDSRLSFLLAVKKCAQDYGETIADRYLPPDEIVWGCYDGYDPTLAINLFGNRT